MLEGSLFDTHCHPFLMDGAPAETVERARRAGVGGFISVGIDRGSSLRSRDLADSMAGVFATAGVHPHTAKDWDAAAGSAIEELLVDPRVVAVGETGLDFHRLLSPAEDQRRVFRIHCGLAREAGKPLVVHTRDAWGDVLSLLAEERAERVVLHCFSGDAAIAREASSRGYYCSFAGNVTYPKNDGLREAAAEVKPDLLLAETDSPFMTPQPLRGTANSPANLALVVEALAGAVGEDPQDVAHRTTDNARHAFRLP